MKRPPRIGVIGSGESRPATYDIASEVGARIAEAGAVLICGGLEGVMRAAAEAARQAGGTIVGILPGDDARAANPGILIPIPTGMGEARNALIVRSSQAVIAIGGGWGTLSEAAFCLKMGVPLIRLRSDLPPLPVPEARDAEEAVSWALEQARRRP